jgi:hypothetical protein
MVVPVEEQTFDDELRSMKTKDDDDKLDPEDPQEQEDGPQQISVGGNSAGSGHQSSPNRRECKDASTTREGGEKEAS